MNLTNTQKELLSTIQSKIARGDIKEISENTGFTREYVGKVLNPLSDTYNESIVNEAVRIIGMREQNTNKMLKKLTAVA